MQADGFIYWKWPCESGWHHQAKARAGGGCGRHVGLTVRLEEPRQTGGGGGGTLMLPGCGASPPSAAAASATTPPGLGDTHSSTVWPAAAAEAGSRSGRLSRN